MSLSLPKLLVAPQHTIMKVLILTLALVASALAFQNGLKFKHLNVEGNQMKGPQVIPRIINGEEAVPHSIPFQVFLTVQSPSGGWYCGGSLISKKYVLTAGHCGDGATSADVLLGAHNVTNKSESTQKVVKSKSITVHPKFDINTISNDIAVIELAEEVELNDNIQVVPLPKRSDESNTYDNEKCKVSGWGLTDGFGDTISPVLNFAESTIMSNKECRSIFDILLDSGICMSGENQRSSCNGDSGGPLTVDGVQVGVVSFGIRYCIVGYPSAFTRVTSYLDWIEQNTDVVLN